MARNGVETSMPDTSQTHSQRSILGAGSVSYHQARMKHWDAVAAAGNERSRWARYYQKRLAEVYKFAVPPGRRILEIGCGGGDLLASLKPSFGVGLDLSRNMLQLAHRRHPELHFLQADAHNIPLTGTFDVIIFSDLFNDVWDVQGILEEVHAMSRPDTRLIINIYSRLWEIPLTLAQRMGLAQPTLTQNWLTVDDIYNLLSLSQFEVIRSWTEFILPTGIRLLAALFNKGAVRFWPFRHLALTNFILARPSPIASLHNNAEPKVSVIVPARNEAGNIHQIFERIPKMGRETEIVFVEGGSSDDTYTAIEQEMALHPEKHTQLHRQSGIGKGDAVRLGFEKATGDILMILDADLTVPPEYLPRFYKALCERKGEFINGVRLVYPMEKQAMKFLNLLGNKFFSLAFSWLLGQSIKDTLCGTKVLWKDDYLRIAANRHYFGEFDPFGDFDLLFGAAKLGLKIVDLPIRYRERTYGTTNIQRWKHGMLLLRMVLFAAARIKFV